MLQLDELFLHEQLLLLALHDEKGTMQGQSFELGAAGAILVELLHRGRIGIDETGKKRPLKLLDAGSLGDPILDEACAQVRTAKRPAPMGTWLRRIAGTRRLRHRIADRLRYRGVLGKQEGRVLLVFTRALYPTLNPAPEHELVERLRHAVLGTEEVAPRTAVMAALAQHLGLLRPAFTRAELKGKKPRLKQLAALESVDDATRAAIASVRKAMDEDASAAAIVATG